MGKKDRKMIVTDDRTYRVQDTSLPHAIVVDLDGTVALITGRNPFDQTRWHQDRPNQPIIDMVDTLKVGYNELYGEDLVIIFVTGREGGDENTKAIEEWLLKHTGMASAEYVLCTRTPKDQRGDAIVKKELYDAYIQDKYCVRWVLEDRDTVVKFWRDDMKLPTLQVYWGDF